MKEITRTDFYKITNKVEKYIYPVDSLVYYTSKFNSLVNSIKTKRIFIGEYFDIVKEKNLYGYYIIIPFDENGGFLNIKDTIKEITKILKENYRFIDILYAREYITIVSKVGLNDKAIEHFFNGNYSKIYYNSLRNAYSFLYQPAVLKHFEREHDNLSKYGLTYKNAWYVLQKSEEYFNKFLIKIVGQDQPIQLLNEIKRKEYDEAPYLEQEIFNNTLINLIHKTKAYV